APRRCADRGRQHLQPLRRRRGRRVDVRRGPLRHGCLQRQSGARVRAEARPLRGFRRAQGALRRLRGRPRGRADGLGPSPLPAAAGRVVRGGRAGTPLAPGAGRRPERARPV
ncbi:unnamed protein product, partial [Prorocentrum cordatum]